MSSNLMWRPVLPQTEYDLSKAMKFRISRRLWDTDGSCGIGEAFLTVSDVPFLEGMIAAGNDEIQRDCRTLIDAIEKYGTLVLWHQH